jgi:3-hydroxyacyl-[acyl-carrier-protein] dehydratase
MLKGSLYSVVAVVRQEGSITAELLLNPDSEIFKGHFPGQPVLPGACMLQMLKEVLEEVLNKKLRLKKADQLKFLLSIDPNVNSNLKLSVSYIFADDIYAVTASMNIEVGVCFRFKGSFVSL